MQIRRRVPDISPAFHHKTLKLWKIVKLLGKLRSHSVAKLKQKWKVAGFNASRNRIKNSIANVINNLIKTLPYKLILL